MVCYAINCQIDMKNTVFSAFLLLFSAFNALHAQLIHEQAYWVRVGAIGRKWIGKLRNNGL